MTTRFLAGVFVVLISGSLTACGPADGGTGGVALLPGSGSGGAGGGRSASGGGSGATGGGSGATGGGSGATGGSGPPTSAPAPIAKLTGTQVSWNGISAVMPAGWDIKWQSPTGGLSMGTATDHCRITLLPLVPAEADQDAQALARFNAGYEGYAIKGIETASPLYNWYHHRGVLAEGWPYVELAGLGVDASKNETGERLAILFVKLGTQSATMFGWDRDTGCLDSSAVSSGAWARVIDSLSFPSFTSSTPNAMTSWIVGGWFATVGDWGVSDVYAANGHYEHTEPTPEYDPVTPKSLIYEKSSSWSGDGFWRLTGNKLTVWPAGRQATTWYVRVYKEYNPALDPSDWFPRLYRLVPCDDSTDLCEADTYKVQ